MIQVALTFDTEFPGRPHRPGGGGPHPRDARLRANPWNVLPPGPLDAREPQLARRIAAAGHLLGNHSNYHAPMDALSDEWLRDDIKKAEATIIETTGVDPKPWFRCPFGSGMDDPRVLAAIEELGYRHVGWDEDPARLG